ncbi:MAG: hypothetical protein Q9177_003330 [Variospora cf. flavescens]
MHHTTTNSTLRSSNAYVCFACRLRTPYLHPQPRRQQHAATQPPKPGADILTHQYGQVSEAESAIAEKAGSLNQSIKSGSKAARSKQAASPRSPLEPGIPSPEARKLQLLLHEKFVAQRRKDAASMQFADHLERGSQSRGAKAKAEKRKLSKADKRKRRVRSLNEISGDARTTATPSDDPDAAQNGLSAIAAVPKMSPKISKKKKSVEGGHREPEETSSLNDSVELRQTSEPETSASIQTVQNTPSGREGKKLSLLEQLKTHFRGFGAAAKTDESADQRLAPPTSSPPALPTATHQRSSAGINQETKTETHEKAPTPPKRTRIRARTKTKMKLRSSPKNKDVRHAKNTLPGADKDSHTLVRRIGSKPLTPDEIKREQKRLRLNRAKEVQVMNARSLSITALDIKQPPVPRLSYGLERVLFNPGVYHLQDPRSRVYNFDPYLQTIMPAKEFDFNALKEYITSSRDMALRELAECYKKRYVGSSSSMTGVLAHFHFLLSQWRPINTNMLSREFPEQNVTEFTELQRSPAAIFLKWRNGSYAIDADKEFASANILMMLGKSMEKLLTLDTEDFEKYRKSNPDKVPEEERKAPEAYHYSTMKDFIMRSQLDAQDPRLPGTGMFDLKTRAVVSVRMEASNYEEGSGYQIKSRQGAWESFEREYFDMIRSAFLKYSLQVRMGRMDGIFVAFHNTDRIFGFQYVSLAEMDSTLHGQWDINLGDQEFKLSVALLNEVLDKATKKYPNTSLRLHFETRKTQTPFMYIFAEPVTEEQIEAIQTAKNADIQKFEDEIYGKKSDSNDDEETDQSWDSLEANVQNAMDEDLRDPNHEDGRQDRDTKLANAEHGDWENNLSVNDHDTIGEYANKESINIENGKEASDGLESEGPDEQETAMEEEEEDDDGEEEDAEIEEEDEADQDDERQVLDGENNADQVTEGIDSLDKDMESSHGTSEDHEGGEVGTDTNEQEPLQEDNSAAASASSSKNTDSQSGGHEVLALTLTVRNQVNGSNVQRPVNLQAKDRWTVEYSLDEVSTPERAWSLYQACQVRRKKKLDDDKARSENDDNVDGYIRRLRQMSRNGAKWRKAQDDMDRELPVKVLGHDT